jgi:hypothetical protein
MAQDDNMIAALKRERATYVARGMDDRVAQVDEQLAHYGHEPSQTKDEPQGRTAPDSQQQTADSSGPKDAGQDKSPAKKTAAPAKKAAAAPAKPDATSEPRE